MLKYALFPFKLTGKKDYKAVIQENVTINTEELADLIAKPGSTVTKAELLAITEEMTLAILQVLKSGGSVNTEMFSMKLSITGLFNDEEDHFDPSKHEDVIKVTPGNRIKKGLGDVSLEKVLAIPPHPILNKVYDFKSDSSNKVLTP